MVKDFARSHALYGNAHWRLCLPSRLAYYVSLLSPPSSRLPQSHKGKKRLASSSKPNVMEK
jgi:hypothetical protein